MKLTDKLKTQAEYTDAKEEKKKAAVHLSDDSLGMVSGGEGETFFCSCPLPFTTPENPLFCLNCNKYINEYSGRDVYTREVFRS